MSAESARLLEYMLSRSTHMAQAAERLAEHAVDLATESAWAHERLMAEERNVSAGYLRRAPNHRARTIKHAPESITDDWIKTGRGSAA